MEKRIEKMLNCLGKELFNEIITSKTDFNIASEIRVSANDKIRIFSKKKPVFESKKIISVLELNSIFAAFCEFSVHAYKREIAEGFITYEGGIRIGICGTAVYIGDKIEGIKDISALVIRIPHEIFDISDKIIPYIYEGGILIVGPPCSGKTTLLRDFSRKSSNDFFVTITDERREIAAVNKGTPNFDIGKSTVLNGFEKAEGIKIAVRSLSPEIIICDEFGGEKDFDSAMFAMKSGVKIVASIHAADSDDLKTKPMFKRIVESGIFRTFVFLNKDFEIYKISDAKELLY